MTKVYLKDVAIRIKDKVDKDNTDLEFYIGGEHFDNGEIQITKRGVIAGSTIGPAFHMRFLPGDVLLMSRNPHLRKAGVVDFEGICSDVSYVCRTKDENVLMQKFLPFIFQTDDFWRFAEENKKGSTNFFLNWSDFEKYEFNLPPIDTQRKLVEILWSFEDTKTAYKKLLEKTDELVKSQFIELFADTEKGVLSDVALITMGQSPDGKTYNDSGDGMAFYQGKTEFSDLYIGEATTWTTAPSRIAVANDVLMSVRAPVGSTNIATEECCIGRGLASIRPLEGKTTTMFILYAMRSIEDDIANMGVGSTFKAINKDQVYKLPIPIAEMELQNQFVEIAEQSDKSKFELKQAIADVDNLEKALMQQELN